MHRPTDGPREKKKRERNKKEKRKQRRKKKAHLGVDRLHERNDDTSSDAKKYKTSDK